MRALASVRTKERIRLFETEPVEFRFTQGEGRSDGDELVPLVQELSAPFGLAKVTHRLAARRTEKANEEERRGAAEEAKWRAGSLAPCLQPRSIEDQTVAAAVPARRPPATASPTVRGRPATTSPAA